MVDDTGRAAALLREVRRRARLTQVQLADRAGVTQSVISAYESGAREPSVPMLARLVTAAGDELVLTTRQAQARPVPLSGPLGRRVAAQRTRLLAATERARVSNVRLFGSVAQGEDTVDSDVDLLVDLPSDMGLFGIGRLQAELEEILGAPVDLVPADGLKPGVRERVQREQVAL